MDLHRSTRPDMQDFFTVGFSGKLANNLCKLFWSFGLRCIESECDIFDKNGNSHKIIASMSSVPLMNINQPLMLQLQAPNKCFI